MKHTPLHFTLIAVIFFLCCDKNSHIPPTAATTSLPCDSVFTRAIVDWIGKVKSDSLETFASRLEKIIRSGSECHDRVSDSLVAEAWYSLGGVFNLQSDFPQARRCFEKALVLRVPIFGKKHKDVLRSYHMVGFMYAREIDYHTALTYYDSAGVWTPASAVSPFIPNLTRTGIAYRELKEYSRAKVYFQMAVDSIKSKEKKDARWLSDALLQFSSCCREMRQYKEAIEKGIESATVAWESNNLVAEADAYLAIGNAYQDSALYCKENNLRQQLFQQAILYTGKAKELFQASQNVSSSFIRTIGNIGEFHRRAGQFDESLTVLSAVLNTQPDKKDPGLAHLYINRGETWMSKGNFEQAIGDYDAALCCLAPAYQPEGALPSPYSTINDRSLLLLLLSDIASAYLDKSGENQAYLDTAAITFDTLLALLNVIRGDFLSDEAKIKLAGDSRNILDKAFGGYLQLYEGKKDKKYLERAFDIAEQRKAFALLEVARLNNADATLSNDLRQRKRTLTQEQSGIEQQKVIFWNDPDSMKILNAAQLRNLEQSRVLQREIKKRNPNYDKLKQKGADLNVAAIQKNMLGEDQGLVEYFCRDSVLEIFLITKTGFKRYTSPIDRADFANAVNEFIQLSARPDIGGERSEMREQQLCSKAHELYLTLLEPLKKDLPVRLIIIPDAPFLTLPFEALAMNPASGDIHQQIVDRNFMLFDHSISYCFSANLLWEMQQSETPAGLKSDLAAFAPRFPEHLVAGSNLPPFFVQTVQDLKPLGNQREVKEIAGKVSVRSYAEMDATKENFWEACKNYAFVHVASHGILNQDPNLNFVAFSQNRDTLDQSELLFLRELYAQRLHQELIVFSACETSLGQYREGEGNLSMARGLAYSGVRSFITTLWKVSPDANRQIMPGFYELFLGKKKHKDVALAEARRAFILASVDNEQLDKWAGLVLIGSTERARQSDWGRWAFAAAIAGGLLLFWANRRRRKSSK